MQNSCGPGSRIQIQPLTRPPLLGIVVTFGRVLNLSTWLEFGVKAFLNILAGDNVDLKLLNESEMLNVS